MTEVGWTFFFTRVHSVATPLQLANRAVYAAVKVHHYKSYLADKMTNKIDIT